jgi:hypothetical protein
LRRFPSILPIRQNCSAKSGSAAPARDRHLQRRRRPAMVMNIALSLTTLGFAIVMAIPLVGPMLF